MTSCMMAATPRARHARTACSHRAPAASASLISKASGKSIESDAWRNQGEERNMMKNEENAHDDERKSVAHEKEKKEDPPPPPPKKKGVISDISKHQARQHLSERKKSGRQFT